MSSNLSAEKAAQIKKLCEQQASLNRMISSIAGTPAAAASVSDPLAHRQSITSANTVKVLGFKSFAKPKKPREVNLQTLCGLNNDMWGIYKDKLKGIASWQGVDTRFSITKQPIQQHVTNIVNKIIQLRPEIKEKILDPDWFIRQTLQGVLKALGKTHWKQVGGKSRNQKAKETSAVVKDKNKDKDKEKSKGKGKRKRKDKDKDKNEDEDKDKDKDRGKDKGKNVEKGEKGEGRKEQEQEDTEMTGAGKILDQSMPQSSTGVTINKVVGTNINQGKGRSVIE
ncbi:hypothetical protein RHS02_08213, partial [Rhizoctonia solani]